MRINLDFLDIVNIIASFQLALFIFFLLFKKTNKHANGILALFLFVQLVIISNFEIFHLSKYINTISPHIFFIGTPFMFLAAPVFYLYIKSVAFSDFRIEFKHLIHGAVFIAAYILFAFIVFPMPAALKSDIALGDDKSLNWLFLICNTGVAIQFGAYFIASWLVLSNYRKKIKEQFSSIKSINLSWISVILWGFLISCCSGVFVRLAINYFEPFYEIFLFLNFFSFFVYFNIIFFKGLTQPEIFSGIEEKAKYLSSKLKNTEGENYYSRLTSFMNDKKPYLDSSLTLKDLSALTEIPARYLSQIINEYANMNFYDYIAWHRIEESKKKLSDASNNKTILEILYSTGFNSKSSFNTAFKKFTGMTPSDFKISIHS